MNHNLSIRNLYVSFGKKEVLKGLNLTVPSPGITCLVGANGSGKTTLIRAILNHIRFKGEINFGDDTIASAIGSIGVVLDEPPFYGHISAIENLQLLMAVQNPRDPEALSVYDTLHLDSQLLKTKAGKLSFGQRHRLAVAGAVLGNHPYLILDEPSVGLDPDSFMSLAKCLKSESEKGKCILVTGHDYELIDLIADHIAVLSDGICSFYGTKQEFESGQSINRIEKKSLFSKEGMHVEK